MWSPPHPEACRVFDESHIPSERRIDILPDGTVDNFARPTSGEQNIVTSIRQYTPNAPVLGVRLLPFCPTVRSGVLAVLAPGFRDLAILGPVRSTVPGYKSYMFSI